MCSWVASPASLRKGKQFLALALGDLLPQLPVSATQAAGTRQQTPGPSLRAESCAYNAKQSAPGKAAPAATSDGTCPWLARTRSLLLGGRRARPRGRGSCNAAPHLSWVPSTARRWREGFSSREPPPVLGRRMVKTPPGLRSHRLAAWPFGASLTNGRAAPRSLCSTRATSAKRHPAGHRPCLEASSRSNRLATGRSPRAGGLPGSPHLNGRGVCAAPCWKRPWESPGGTRGGTGATLTAE